MRSCFAKFTAALLLGLAVFAPASAQAQLGTPEQLAEALKRFPDADPNHDGVLTADEALAYAAKRRTSKPASTRASVAPTPTLEDVSYGPAPRNVLDFWRASAEKPTPVVIYIHGGGFLGDDKSRARSEKLIQQCLDAGVSFAAINYRYLAPGVPIQDVLRDCARAVQFIRTKSTEWNIDKTRVASYGSSAGAGASLWLAFHDDLADPKNADPVLRESTRLVCAGAISPQASYNWTRWPELVGEDALKRFSGVYNFSLLYGLTTAEDLESPAGQKILADCDMLALATKDDPPVFISSSLPDLSLNNSNQFLHHPKHGKALYDRCGEVGISVVASIPAFGITPPKDGPATWRDVVFHALNVK
jgi:acetyl esterase/lipase